MMAMRLARAFTGRDKILRFENHFHGWHDYASVGWMPESANHMPGIPEGVRRTMVTLPTDLARVEEALKAGDIAAVIMEAAGASSALIPLPKGFQRDLRALTQKYDTLLIMDEVVTGFRWSPGGVQAKLGVKPDLTTLAKIVAGGLPGGAVAGRIDVMEQLRFKDKAWNVDHKVLHNGTFNANPLSAAAGIACLDIIADGKVQAFCDGQAVKLRAGLNSILNRHEIEGCAYGESSMFHMLLGVPVSDRGDGDVRDPGLSADVLKNGTPRDIDHALHLAMLHEGVHLFHGGGILGIGHDDQIVADTLTAFERAVVELQSQKML